MSILDLFCSVDDFWQRYEPVWRRTLLQAGRQRLRLGQMHPSAIVTLLIWFHCAHDRTCKAFSTEHGGRHLCGEFPHLLSSQRFVALVPTMVAPLCASMQTQLGAATGIGFVDSRSVQEPTDWPTSGL
jgi:hypothetical protein